MLLMFLIIFWERTKMLLFLYRNRALFILCSKNCMYCFTVRIGNGKTNPNESTTYVTIERRNDQHDQHHQPQPNQQYSFSSRNSISEKDSTSSSFNASNPMRSIYGTFHEQSIEFYRYFHHCLFAVEHIVCV